MNEVWSCKSCTFNNGYKDSKCKMCAQDKPDPSQIAHFITRPSRNSMELQQALIDNASDSNDSNNSNLLEVVGSWICKECTFHNPLSSIFVCIDYFFFAKSPNDIALRHHLKFVFSEKTLQRF